MKSGIYQIINTITNDLYIGSSINLKQEIVLEENLIHQMGINGNTNNIEKLQNNGK